MLSVSAGWALADPVVSSIEVEADFDAVQTEKASNFWPSIEADLEAQLSERLAPYAGDNGLDVKVVIRELSLDATAADRTYRDLNGIEGVVAVRAQDDSYNPQGYRIAYSVLPPGDRPAIPGAIILKPDTSDNYEALIAAIVSQVEDEVGKYDM